MNNSRICEKSIEQFVETLLKNKDINSFLPDCIEKKIYKNLILKTLNIILHFFRDFEINLLNHKIKVKIIPNEE